MKPIKKEIYQDMLKYLEPHGYTLYKEKIWKLDRSIGYVACLEIDSSQWGVINEVLLKVATFQEPLKINEIKKSSGFFFTTCLRLGLYFRKCERINVLMAGDPYQSADEVMRSQYREFLPHFLRHIYPLLAFDRDTSAYLYSMERIQQMDCEAMTGTKGIRNTDLALEYYRYDDITGTKRIIAQKVMLCDAMTDKFKESDQSALYWDSERKKAMELSDKMNKSRSIIDRVIRENMETSHRSCELFFSKRYLSNYAW